MPYLNTGKANSVFSYAKLLYWLKSGAGGGGKLQAKFVGQSEEKTSVSNQLRRYSISIPGRGRIISVLPTRQA
jgi:hypothetical protein